MLKLFVICSLTRLTDLYRTPGLSSSSYLVLPLRNDIPQLPRRLQRVLRQTLQIRIPSPPFLFLVRQLAIQHLNHKLAKYRQEFPTVEGAPGGDVKVLAARVRGDVPVVVLRQAVPGG